MIWLASREIPSAMPRFATFLFEIEIKSLFINFLVLFIKVGIATAAIDKVIAQIDLIK